MEWEPWQSEQGGAFAFVMAFWWSGLAFSCSSAWHVVHALATESTNSRLVAYCEAGCVSRDTSLWQPVQARNAWTVFVKWFSDTCRSTVLLSLKDLDIPGGAWQPRQAFASSEATASDA